MCDQARIEAGDVDRSRRRWYDHGQYVVVSFEPLELLAETCVLGSEGVDIIFERNDSCIVR